MHLLNLDEEWLFVFEFLFFNLVFRPLQSPSKALTLMEQILEREPGNPLALYGRARALDALAEAGKSNAQLEQAIFAYRAVLDLEDRVEDDLFRRAALRCIDRMRFRGTIRE